MRSSKYVSGTPKREVVSAEGPSLPAMCDVADCTSFYPGRGEPCRRGRADVVFSDRWGNPVHLCCYHYDVGLYKAGKGRMSEVTGDGINLTIENVREHWAKVDARELAQADKRQRLLENERNRREP